MADQLRTLGFRFIVGTIAGIAFVIAGLALGPTTLVLTLLGIGAVLIVAARVVEARSPQEHGAANLKEN